MKDNHIFIQTNYYRDQESLAKEGCNFLTLCKIGCEINKAFPLKTKEDVIDFASQCQKEGIIDSDFFVNSPIGILSKITSMSFTQYLTLTSASGLAGAREWLPIHYPVPEDAIEIACYRRKDNFKLTHFSQVQTSSGETFKCTNLFNTLGEDWLEDNKDNWYASDKRVYLRKD